MRRIQPPTPRALRPKLFSAVAVSTAAFLLATSSQGPGVTLADQAPPAAPAAPTIVDDAAPEEVGTPPRGVVAPDLTLPAVGLLDRSADGTADAPSVAIAAYLHAAAVIDAAAPGCHLDWTLLAGLGDALTDHGRLSGDHRLDDRHRVRPAIVGDRLRDDAGQRVPDSDAGKLDGDDRHDRAVGPMLLSPSAWRTIGVDGDADELRDPQDLDDAALATAVLLCSTGADLTDLRERRDTLLETYGDEAFVMRVLALTTQYAATPASSVVPVRIDAPVPVPPPTTIVRARPVGPTAPATGRGGDTDPSDGATTRPVKKPSTSDSGGKDDRDDTRPHGGKKGAKGEDTGKGPDGTKPPKPPKGDGGTGQPTPGPGEADGDGEAPTCTPPTDPDEELDPAEETAEDPDGTDPTDPDPTGLPATEEGVEPDPTEGTEAPADGEESPEDGSDDEVEGVEETDEDEDHSCSEAADGPGASPSS
ncbi:hypothetical protein KUV85_00630 [Nocardioides panacisoli]|uniref:hypothetical protein n=1 Tax=Nocardioides panacisoli TaxID=627624 RepID=UPI001C634B87|nr:hypothetical protein [Nocardioides panacisoli]QYJ04219.1 hypothetical protein KUV85_00630 [Nocardioides panacisoli]